MPWSYNGNTLPGPNPYTRRPRYVERRLRGLNGTLRIQRLATNPVTEHVFEYGRLSSSDYNAIVTALTSAATGSLVVEGGGGPFTVSRPDNWERVLDAAAVEGVTLVFEATATAAI